MFRRSNLAVPTAPAVGVAGGRTFLPLPSVPKVGAHLKTDKDFPPRQRPASFSTDQIVERLVAGLKGKQ